MIGRYVLAFALLLLVAAPMAGGAGEHVDGVLEAEGLAQLAGTIEATVPDPVLWLHTPESIQTAPLTLEAEAAVVTYKELRIETVFLETPVNDYRVALPQQVETEETTHENITITLSSLGPYAEVLVEPGDQGLVANLETTEETSNLGAFPDGLHVVDAYTDIYEEGDDHTDPEFRYENRINRGLTWFNQPSNVTVQGSMTSYLWDTTVEVYNETSTFHTYNTGREERTTQEGTMEEVIFSYVLLDLEGVRASWANPPPSLKTLAPGVNLDLEGTLHLDNPHGTLSSTDGLYRSAGVPQGAIEGTFTIDARPGAPLNAQPTLTLGIHGLVAETNLPLIETDDGLSASSVVAGAGGLTVLGVALWYVVSGKVAALGLVGAIRPPKQETVDSVAMNIEDPQELLRDPDRFALYHLLRERIGLSAGECANLTGIEEPRSHLELMVSYGLLSRLEDAPDRYMIPGHVSTERQAQILTLREPDAERLGTLIATNGLTPESMIVQRAQTIDNPLPADRVKELLDEFEERGLIYREPSDGGRVVDPTRTLHECLDRM